MLTLCTLYFFIAVEIGVSPDEYTVSEADGFVNITLRIISGQTAVTIPINIATEDGTAVCTLQLYQSPVQSHVKTPIPT